MREPTSDSAEMPKHLDSETESEGEDEASCQADQVCHFSNGKAAPLSTHPCRDVSSGGPVQLLTSDATKSNIEELTEDGVGWTFRACNHHRAMYELSAAKRRCVVDGCPNEAKSNRDGLKLCKLHAAREEKTKEVPPSKQAEPKASAKVKPVRSRSRSKSRNEPLTEETQPATEEAVARIAPGDPPQQAETSKESLPVVSTSGAEVLGLYLSAILQGVDEDEALSLVSSPECGPRETRSVLKEAAVAYLPKLPQGYPAAAKKALVSLILEETIALDQYDPVLTLRPTQTMKTLSGSPDYHQAPPPVRSVPQPVRTEEIGWQALYRPRGAQSLPEGIGDSHRYPPRNSAMTPPDAQGAFAFAARPRHTGAFTDAEPQGLDETAKALQAIAKSLVSKDEAAGQERGKLSSIGKLEERLVYLMRGCDGLTVPIGAATVGKELFQALKATSTQGRPQLRAIQFPMNLNNRVAFGLASLSLGGKDTRQLPDHCLSAADFPLTSEEDFDRYAGTVDNKLEKRPKPPVTLSQWYRNALREAWAVACVMGTEHYSTFESAATYLLKLGEEHAYMWPPTDLGRTMGTVCGRAQGSRQANAAGDERRFPTFERIRFFATAPGPDGLPWLKLPRTFYLEDEVEYFQADIVPRHNRMLSRACWQVALKKNSPLVGQRAGGESEEHVAGGTEADVRPDPKAKVSEAPKLMGEPLTGREGARSLDHI